jgi:pimeloyl-ACP methyl ester carboxylesterase
MRRQISIKSMLLAHDDLGSGPPVVLLHAGVADRSMWSEHVEPLVRAGYRVLALDLPGFGDTPAADQPPWDAVLETLDAADVDRFALVGNSMGGALALIIAVLVPKRVTAVAVVSAPPPVFEPSPELLRAWEAEEDALERGDVEGAVAVVVETWTLPDAPPQLRERVATMQRRAFAQQAAAATTGSDPDPLERDPSALTRLSLPALVAVGELDMADFRAGAKSMAQAIPGARHAVIAGAGHLAPLEQPEAFRELLLGYLAETVPLA